MNKKTTTELIKHNEIINESTTFFNQKNAITHRQSSPEELFPYTAERQRSTGADTAGERGWKPHRQPQQPSSTHSRGTALSIFDSRQRYRRKLVATTLKQRQPIASPVSPAAAASVPAAAAVAAVVAAALNIAHLAAAHVATRAASLHESNCLCLNVGSWPN